MPRTLTTRQRRVLIAEKYCGPETSYIPLAAAHRIGGFSAMAMLNAVGNHLEHLIATEVVQDPNDWFPMSTADVAKRLGVPFSQQYRHLQKLIESDIVERKFLGLPAKRYLKVNWDRVEAIVKDHWVETTKHAKVANGKTR